MSLGKPIDLTLEISQGCRFSCTGCTVDRDNNDFPTEAEFDRIDALLDDLEANGCALMNLTLGPTDILVSANRAELFQHPRLQRIARRFLKTTLNCSFLYPDEAAYRWLAEQIELLIPNGLVKFTVPFEVNSVRNSGYIGKIAQRIKLVEEHLRSVGLYKVYTVINFEESIEYDRRTKTKMTKELMRRTLDVALHERPHIDFILPQGREDLGQPEIQQRLLASIMRLNELMVEIKQESVTDGGFAFDINELQSQEGEDWDLIYRNGELYLPPFVLEAFTSFDPSYRLPGEWTYRAIYEQEEARKLQQLSYALKTDRCGQCPHVMVCIERGMLDVMEKLKVTHCISAVGMLPEYFNWNT